VGVCADELDPVIHGSDDRERIDVFFSMVGLMGFPGLGVSSWHVRSMGAVLAVEVGWKEVHVGT
jgi:hypothetical protein